MAEFAQAAVIGVGLIGGSFALALKDAGVVERVAGVGRDAENLRTALARGIIDIATHDVAEAVREADLVFVATPVGAMAGVFARIAPVLKPGALITDGGSTKQSVIEAARKGLGARIAQFVPSHPIAGSEKSGAAAASSTLYLDHEVVLTPLPENRPEDVARIRALWARCGARVVEMNAREHDAVMAAVSHAPHFIAFAYMHAIAARKDATDLLVHAGGGLRDFTRIASSHPRMWSDICMANREALLAELARFEQAVGELRALLEANDAAELEARFSHARALRDAWIASQVAPPEGE
ncbi:MAG: prephenate dehydrogenase/arogenate dehydrogenase family protein [Burkholderiales bacterium]|nr:prephenate dehydrogenase/arogenate dehydrogenase family protein [Burkholderiales bacterium]PZN03963.1 MAG: prephenate dehydrogenase/arogenate dehydrogenase family protein [Pseudomonadota bacterium]